MRIPRFRLQCDILISHDWLKDKEIFVISCLKLFLILCSYHGALQTLRVPSLGMMIFTRITIQKEASDVGLLEDLYPMQIVFFHFVTKVRFMKDVQLLDIQTHGVQPKFIKINVVLFQSSN